MVCGDIIAQLSVEILKPDRELSDRLVRFLAHGKELSEQFSLWHFSMEEF